MAAVTSVPRLPLGRVRSDHPSRSALPVLLLLASSVTISFSTEAGPLLYFLFSVRTAPSSGEAVHTLRPRLGEEQRPAGVAASIVRRLL